MGLAKLLALLKPKPKIRPIYVGDTLVGYDDGLPNSIKIDVEKLITAISPSKNLNQVSYPFLSGIGLLKFYKVEVAHDKIFADVNGIVLQYSHSYITTGHETVDLRMQYPAEVSYYADTLQCGASTGDYSIWKRIAGTLTTLATEAVDLTDDTWYYTGVRCVGTTINGCRDLNTDATPPTTWDWYPVKRPTIRLTATDTSLSSGRVSFHSLYNSIMLTKTTAGARNCLLVLRDKAAINVPESSPQPEPIAFFEMPIVGEGKMPPTEMMPITVWDTELQAQVNPFTVQMPQEIVEVEKPIPTKWLEQKVNILKAKGWTTEEIKAFLPEAYPVERINRLAVTWSALIPTDSKGKPTSNTAIVRIFPSTPEYVHPIEKRIQAIKEMRGVRQLSREEAIDLALKMDDRLHIHDLVPCTKHDLGGKCFQEYRDWRIGTIGDKPEFADTDIRKAYVKEGKGW